MSRVLFCGFLAPLFLVACGLEPPDSTGSRRSATTLDLGHAWQPFAASSVWGLKLPAARSETRLPSTVWDAGPFGPSDTDYGIKVYFAKSSDPTWSLTYQNYDTWTDDWNVPDPLPVQAPAGIVPPDGSDASVIVVDAAQRYAYEMWQFQVTGKEQAAVSSINLVDVRASSSGIHRTVGLTGAGLPGSGGLLKMWETAHHLAIQHKFWVAVNPDALYKSPVWPASASDLGDNGGHAFLHYGDVIAISKSVDLDSCGCTLSPFIKRIMKGLQDYGGLVQDQGGDGIDLVGEVDAVKGYIDVDYDTEMWSEFDCMKQYLVKVDNPWG